MCELDELERALLEAADTWFSQGLHMKLQRLTAVARQGERAVAALDAVVARMTQPPKFNPPLDPVDQPAAPKSPSSGGAAAQFAEPADMHGNGA